MIIKKLVEEIEIPKGVEFVVEDDMVKIKGEKGEISRNFNAPSIGINVKEEKVILNALTKKLTKRDKRMIKTIRAHIVNMINGVVNGYEYKLKICSGHFPMTFNVEGGGVSIKNFFGEKVPRKMNFKDVVVKVEGDIITVSGVDKEIVGNVSARIEHATKIKGRDRRVFQDGVWLLSKGKK